VARNKVVHVGNIERVYERHREGADSGNGQCPLWPLAREPITGSGSTGKAAALEGFNFIGCELDATYCDTARRRIEHARTEAGLYATA
jgi:hypothetical protein